FSIPAGSQDFEKVFYMQKQEQYKMGRVLTTNSFIPIPDVHIYKVLHNVMEDLVGVSDKRGIFGLVNYLSGEYQLVFRHPDFYTQEKTIFVRRTDGELGSFFMNGPEPPSKAIVEKNPKFTGITSKKISFLTSDAKYIVDRELFNGRENLPAKTKGCETQSMEKGDRIRMFISAYDSERIALARLEEVRIKSPQAIM